MSDINVARRYADALIELAVESNKIEEFGADLASFAEVMQAHDGMLGQFLSSPVFTTEEREAVLTELFPKLSIDPMIKNLLKVVNGNARFPIFQTLVEQYSLLADEKSGRIRVNVATAEPLTPQLESEIQAALEKATGKKVLIEHHIDPSLIGGMVAKVGSKIYDSSLKTRLERLKNSLIVAQA